jgi:hypothetical protein
MTFDVSTLLTNVAIVPLDNSLSLLCVAPLSRPVIYI